MSRRRARARGLGHHSRAGLLAAPAGGSGLAACASWPGCGTAGQACHPRARFFCALDRVVAAGTRGRPWCTRAGGDAARGGADQTCCQRRRRGDGDQRIPEGRSAAAAQLAERRGAHHVGWRGIDLIVSEATGIQDGTGGAQALAASRLGGTPCMRAPRQGAQDASGHGTSATVGCGGTPLGNTWRDGAHHSRPGKRSQPLAGGDETQAHRR